MKNEEIDADAVKMFNELKYQFGEPITFDDDEIRSLAKYIIDFHVNNFTEWADSSCCAEDFGYKYWELLKESIDKIK